MYQQHCGHNFIQSQLVAFKFLCLGLDFDAIKCTFLKAALYFTDFVLFLDREYFARSALFQSSILLEKFTFRGVLNIRYYPLSQASVP